MNHRYFKIAPYPSVTQMMPTFPEHHSYQYSGGSGSGISNPNTNPNTKHNPKYNQYKQYKQSKQTKQSDNNSGIGSISNNNSSIGFGGYRIHQPNSRGSSRDNNNISTSHISKKRKTY